MRKKKSRNRIPEEIDVREQEIFSKREVIDLGNLLLENLKYQLGEKPLFAIVRRYDSLHEVIEFTADQIVFKTKHDSWNNWTEFSINKRWGMDGVVAIYRKEELAKKACDGYNIKWYEKQIEDIKNEIDKFNIVKVREEAEKKHATLVQKYEDVKIKLTEIKEKDFILKIPNK